jgi:hypothetical protein
MKVPAEDAHIKADVHNYKIIMRVGMEKPPLSGSSCIEY